MNKTTILFWKGKREGERMWTLRSLKHLEGNLNTVIVELLLHKSYTLNIDYVEIGVWLILLEAMGFIFFPQTVMVKFKYFKIWRRINRLIDINVKTHNLHIPIFIRQNSTHYNRNQLLEMTSKTNF